MSSSPGYLVNLPPRSLQIQEISKQTSIKIFLAGLAFSSIRSWQSPSMVPTQSSTLASLQRSPQKIMEHSVSFHNTTFSVVAVLIRCLVAPWGYISSPRKDIAKSCKSKEEGGTGVATEFWDWTENQVGQYV